MATPQLGAAPQESISGDSLTKFVRGMQNTFSTAGTQSYNTGQNIVSAGGKQLQTGNQQYQAGLADVSPVLSYLTSLTKGDQADVSQAIQPEANRIKDSFTAIRNMISAQPRGGGKAGVLAEAPYKQAQQIGDTAAKARQDAAGQLGQLSTTLAGLGQSQEGVALGEQGVGLQEANLGEQALATGDQAAMTRRGQDMNTTFAGQFEQVTQGLKNLI